MCLFKISIMLLFTFLFTGCSTYHISPARYRATMKPYVKKGQYYKPHEIKPYASMIGYASWYGPKFHGRLTSSGERYNMFAYTAAHKTWPLGTLVRVENLKTHKSVVVRINDRGPFVSNRIIDCSYAAARKIGLDKDGVAPVKIVAIGRT